MKELYQIILIAILAVAALSYVAYTLQKALLLRRIGKSGLIEAITERINPSTVSAPTSSSTPRTAGPSRLKKLFLFGSKTYNQTKARLKDARTKWRNFFGNLKSTSWMKKHKYWTRFGILFILIIFTVIILSILSEAKF